MRGNAVLLSAQTRMLSGHVSTKMADQKNLSFSVFQFLYKDQQKIAVCGLIGKRRYLRFPWANICGVPPLICGFITMFLIGK